MIKTRKTSASLMFISFVMILVCSSVLTHGYSYEGEGCYCHNSGISVMINEDHWGQNAYFSALKVQPGGSISLHVSTIDIEAQNADPWQEWPSSQSHNAEFIFSPQIVYDNSPEDLSPTNGTITCTYTITAPLTLENNYYEIALTAQGVARVNLGVSVEGEPIPEFDNAVLILTFSVFTIVAVFAVMRSRKRLPKT